MEVKSKNAPAIPYGFAKLIGYIAMGQTEDRVLTS